MLTREPSTKNVKCMCPGVLVMTQGGAKWMYSANASNV